MSKPTTRYIHGMFDRTRMTARQQAALDRALAALEKLSAARAITFAVVDDHRDATPGGRKRRRDRKDRWKRPASAQERRVLEYMKTQARPVSNADVAAGTGISEASVRATIHFLKHLGLAERTNPSEKIALYQPTEGRA